MLSNNIRRGAITALSEILLWRIPTAPFQVGDLTETAIVCGFSHDLSEQVAKDLTQTLDLWTCTNNCPSFIAEANSSMVWSKLIDGVDVLTIPSDFLSAKTMIIFKMSGSPAFAPLAGWAIQSITSVFHFKILAMAEPTPSANLFLASVSERESLERLLRCENVWTSSFATFTGLALLPIRHLRIWVCKPHLVPMFHIPLIDSQAVSNSVKEPLMVQKILKYSQQPRSQTDGTPLPGCK